MKPSEICAEHERRSARDQEARHAVEAWSADPHAELWIAVGEVAADKPGTKYAASVHAHSETVLRTFYDFHRVMGSGPVLNRSGW